MPQENKRCFIDSNIWLYALVHGGDVEKEQRSTMLLENVVSLLSVQVINEVCSNLLKWKETTEEQLVSTVTMFYETCAVEEITLSTLLSASRLRKKYSLSYYDSLIVASALESNAEVLYTEDMHHGLIVDNRLTILNPFDTRK